MANSTENRYIMNNQNYKKKILIDLDGVLNEYGKEKFDENYIPEIKDGAKEFIQELNKK